MNHLFFPRLPALGALAFAFTGCTIPLMEFEDADGPPVPRTPAAFADDSASAGTPTDLPPDWWALYDDAELAGLIERALDHNQDLAAAAYRVDQVRAIAGQARADLFPQLAIEAGAGRAQSPETGYRPSDYVRLPGLLSYELDLWGGVRQGASAASAEAEAGQRRYESARISLAAQVAETLFLLRAARLEEGIVAASIETRREARELVAAQTRLGRAAELELAQADTLLATAETELEAIARRRASLTYALALLVGEPATSFTLPADRAVLPVPPVVPGGLPADLLSQRPDLAATERQLDAAADRIGVARAAFYPSIRLTASAGWESNDFDSVITGANQVWSIGPQVYLPIFQGGRNRARWAEAHAVYAERQAAFRQAVLVALHEVQDALTAGRLIARQGAANQRATEAARRAAALSRSRYDAGLVGYLEVVDSERIALAAERGKIQIEAQRLLASIHLIKALGGGWQAEGEALEAADEARPQSPLAAAPTAVR